MRKLYALVIALFATLFVQAQIGITVTGSSNTTPNLSASYPSLSAALNDLNAVTAMSGPVTLTLAAGASETAPVTGFTLGSSTLNPVLSSTNTILIIKASGAATVLSAGVGTSTPASATPDGIFKIVGADYVTVDGVTFTDGNTTNPATMEFGLALFKASATDGTQNCTIRNCTFNMQRVNNAGNSGPMVEGSVSILMINSIPTAAATALTPTAASGSNSNNKFYSNSINGGNYGIALSGFADATPFTLADTGNDIGGTGSSTATTGNTILNFGGGGTSNPSAGIRANNQWNLNISNNSINNNNGSGTNHGTTLRGIYAQAGTSANATITYNTITLASAATTSSLNAIENGIGSTAASNTVTISNNTIQNCSYPTATSGTFHGILNAASPANLVVNNNQVVNNTIGASGTASSAVFYGIYNSTSSTSMAMTANGNTISNNTMANSYGTIYAIRVSTVSPFVGNANTITNLSIPNSAGATSANIYGIYNAASPVTETYTNNIINNLTITGSNTSTSCVIYGIFNNTLGTSPVVISGNSVTNLSYTSTGAGSATAVGIRSAYGLTINMFRNLIHTISSTGTTPLVAGIYIGSGSITTANVYNNYIGNLSTPASTGANLHGIYTGTVGTNLNFYNNTVYINASSTGTNFGSSAFYMASTTPTVLLQNNILVNVSTATGTGLTAAIRRTSATLTAFDAASNNNDLFAGTPGASNVIYYDGTTGIQTLAAYKTAVAPRDASSISELPPFISTTAGAAGYLHITAGATTGLESGGANVTIVTTDYDGDIRAGNAGYTGTGTAPDIGADEFAGVATGVPCTAPSDQASAIVFGTVTGSSQAFTFTAAPSSPTGYLIVRSAGPLTGAPANGTVYSAGTSIGTNGTVVAVSNSTTVSSTGLSSNTAYTYTVFTYNSSNCIGGPVYNVTSPLTASSTTCAGVPTAVVSSAVTTGGFTLNWTAPTGGTAGPITYTVEVATDNAFTAIVSTQNTTATTINITGLSAGTTYYYRVRANNGSCASANTTAATIVTVCVAQPLAIVEGFNASASLPTCWSSAIAAVQTGSKISIVTSSTNPTTNPFEGARFVLYNSFSNTNGAAGSEERLISPQIITTGVASVDVEFYWRNNFNTSYSTGAYLNEGVQVQYSTNGGTTWVDAGSFIPRHDPSLTAGTAQWNKKTVTLPAAAGNQAALLVAFKFHSEYGDNMAIDAVNILATPSCTAPIFTNVNSITSGGATVNFTCASCTGSYVVEYGPVGFTPGTGATAGTGGTVVTGTTTAIAISGLTALTNYQVYVRQNCGAGLFSANTTVGNFQTLCAPPSLTSTTPATRCGIGTVTLAAAAPAGVNINWYTAATGGAPVFTGTSYTTPVISATTTYYAEAAAAGSPFNVGVVSEVPANLGSLGGYGQYFSTVSPAVINTVDIYPSTAGTLNVSLRDASGATVASQAFTIVAADISTTVKKTLTLNFSVPGGVTGWQLYYDLAINRGTGSYTYPNTANGFSITGNTVDGNNITAGTRYYFFNWNVTTFCASARTAVAATVTTPPAITLSATPATICAGQNTTLNVTSSNAGYTYTWTPGNLTGASQTVAPTATTKYILTAVDNSGGANNSCMAKDSITVQVNQLPAAVTITASTTTLCSNNSATLSVNTPPSNVTLGTATTTNTTTGYPAPYSNYYGGTKHQMLIRASELSGLGLSTGSAINSITFDVTAVGTTFTGTLNNFQIDMGHSSSTVLNSNNFESGLVNVKPAGNVSVAVGTVTHTLNTPFVWDGISNIVIQTSYSNTNTGTTNDFVQMKNSDPGFVSTNWYRVDGATAAAVLAAAVPSGSGNARPNMVLGVNNTNTTTWAPVTGLYTDAATTIPYTAGSNATTVYAKPTSNTTYTATVATSAGCSVSNTVAISVTPPTVITTQPVATTICAPAPLNLSVTATGSGTLTYQWRKNGVNISGATASTYQLTSTTIADAGTYDVVITSSCGSITSSSAIVTINPKPVADYTFTAAQCAGTSYTYTSTSTVSAGSISGYDWSFGNTNTSTVNPATNTYATAGSYAARLIVTTAAGCKDTVTKNITVNSATAIATQPVAQTACIGGNATFTVSATGTTLTYQWRKGGAAITGATSNTLNLTNITAADAANYDVVVTGACGAVTSSAVALSLNAATAITTQPVSVTACQGNVTFSVVATGTGTLTYQWRFNGTAIPTATTASISVPVAAASAGNYDVIVTGTCGPVTSSAATLTVQNCTSVPDVTASISDVRLLPNPVQSSSLLRVNAVRVAKISWTITDMNGRIVKRFDQSVTPGTNDHRIFVQELAAGMYQLNGETAKGEKLILRFSKF